MAPPAVVTTNVLVGTAKLFTAPSGTAAVADTIAGGETWGSPWVYIGGTEQGVKLTFGTTTSDITIEEQATPVLVVTTLVNVTIAFSLSEDTVESMKLAYGNSGSITPISGATGIAAKKRLTLSNTLGKLTCGFEATNAGPYPRRVYVPAVMSVGDVETDYRRAANNRSYPVTLRAVCDPSAIVIDDWTAAAAGA